MNGKNIKKHLNSKLNDWLSSIDDENIKSILKENVIITGGAIVSLLTGEARIITKFIMFELKEDKELEEKIFISMFSDCAEAVKNELTIEHVEPSEDSLFGLMASILQKINESEEK